MRSRSEAWARIAADGEFKMDAKLRVGAKEYKSISAPVIDRSAMSAALGIGAVISATLRVSILREELERVGDIERGESITVMARLYRGEEYTEWLPFGTFYIDQRDTSVEGLTNLTCYDALLKANAPYPLNGQSAEEWSPPGNHTRYARDCMGEIVAALGVAGVDARSRFYSYGGAGQIAYPEDKSITDVLSEIATQNGGNWVVTEENYLRLIPLTSSADTTYHIIDEAGNNIVTVEGDTLASAPGVYNKPIPGVNGLPPHAAEADVHSYITDEAGNRILLGGEDLLAYDPPVTVEDGDVSTAPPPDTLNVPAVCGGLTTGGAVTVTGVASKLSNGQDYIEGDSSGYVLSLPDDYRYAGNVLMNAYKGLVYTPYTAGNAIFDPAAELGDMVAIGDLAHGALLQETLTLGQNFRANIGAPNSNELTEEYPFLDTPSTKKVRGQLRRIASVTGSNGEMEQLREAVAELQKEIAALREEVAAMRGELPP